MSTNTQKISFEVLIDEPFTNINSDTSLINIGNKNVLSLINDYEEGDWWYSKFQNFIWDNICETSLSFRERESLISQPQSLLIAAAKNLRLSEKENDISKGSELAEIILYGIMKHHFKALPIVPKIFYKQNNQDNAKGADSVHIVLSNDNDFTIWFGESKFYSSIEDARLPKIIESVENSLNKEKIKKENSIITSISDIDSLAINDELRIKIKNTISNQKSIDILKPKLNIPILLLHECNITNTNNEISDAFLSEIKKFHIKRAESYFKKQIKKFGSSIHKYSKIKFHLILFPVPQKTPIINTFVDTAIFYRKH